MNVPMAPLVTNILFSLNLFGSMNCLFILFVIDQDYWFGLGFTAFLQRAVSRPITGNVTQKKKTGKYVRF